MAKKKGVNLSTHIHEGASDEPPPVLIDCPHLNA